MSIKTVQRYIAVSVLFFVLYFVYNFFIATIVTKYGIHVPQTRVMASDWGKYIASHPFQGSIILFMSALFEEIGFRLIPLSLFVLIPRLRKFWLIPAIASSYLFGYLHGDQIFSYLIGGMGLIFSVQTVAYWKLDTNQDFAYACVATGFMHFLLNATIVYLA